MYDVSVTSASQIVAAAFRWSHLVFASATYNAGIFVTMEALINDLTAHNIQNRTAAIIENGSWAATSGGLIREKLKKCRNMTFVDKTIKITSCVKSEQLSELHEMAEALAETLSVSPNKKEFFDSENISDPMFKLSYGLFILSAKNGNKDNGCIINTVTQITENPLRISVAVNRSNLTHEMIVNEREFNISVLTKSTPFSVIEKFGFKSGRDTKKFSEYSDNRRTNNGIRYLTEFANAVISAKVDKIIDFETHSLFIANIVQTLSFSNESSLTYQYYFDNIKLEPKLIKEIKKGYICKICGYVYDSDILPDDYICPLCKHGKDDFEEVKANE